MFRTEVNVSNSNLNLSLRDSIVTIGSCFAEVIGSKLLDNKISALVNPFGTIFNPLSVSSLLTAASGTSYDFEKNLVKNNGIWYSYDFHSSISSPDKNILLKTVEERIQTTRVHLEKTSLLIITLGTAVSYKLASDDTVVANCHKLPAKTFRRELLDQQEIIDAFDRMLKTLKSVNPHIKILLTVSPVRHTKETMLMNSVSKSLLRHLCYQLQLKHKEVDYFPAFEIMMDDLRDYRYYKEDLIHPTTLAEDYIWHKFVAAYFDSEFQNFIQEWSKIKKALHHKPFHPNTESHSKFLLNTKNTLESIALKYKVDITEELKGIPL